MAGQARHPVGRGEHARDRVLQAALVIAAEDGLGALTMEAVARRAGASKATLYRRWPSREALLVDAMGSSFRPVPAALTGETHHDLVALVRSGEALVARQPFGRLLAAVIAAAEEDRALASVHDELTERRRQPFREVLERALARGEIAPDADLELATDLLGAPLFYRRFVAHRPPPAGYAESLVDTVLRGLAPVTPNC